VCSRMTNSAPASTGIFRLSAAARKVDLVLDRHRVASEPMFLDCSCAPL